MGKGEQFSTNWSEGRIKKSLKKKWNMGNVVGSRNLSKADLQFLVDHTKYDADWLKKKHLEFRRHCPSGKLLPSQFSAMYSVFFPHHCADDFCRHVFRTFDCNRDGIVDFREYMLALHVITNGSEEEKLARAFRLFDIDNNGVIDPEEVTEIARAILQVVRPASLAAPSLEEARQVARSRAKQIFREMDGRGRGFVTRGQFVETCLRKHTLAKMLTHSSCLVNILTFPKQTEMVA